MTWHGTGARWTKMEREGCVLITHRASTSAWTPDCTSRRRASSFLARCMRYTDWILTAATLSRGSTDSSLFTHLACGTQRGCYASTHRKTREQPLPQSSNHQPHGKRTCVLLGVRHALANKLEHAARHDLELEGLGFLAALVPDVHHRVQRHEWHGARVHVQLSLRLAPVHHFQPRTQHVSNRTERPARA